METMEISVPAGMAKKEWFTTAEFARGVKVTPNALQRWIKKHSEFRGTYCQNISKSGKKPRWLIFWKGIAVYVSWRDVARNQKQQTTFKDGFSNTAALTKAKIVVAQKANETIGKEKSQISPKFDKFDKDNFKTGQYFFGNDHFGSYN